MAGRSRNGIVAWSVAGVVAGMVGMSYAAVPLYQLFCQVTGFGGTTRVAAAPVSAPKPDARVVRVTFDANVVSGLPWSFVPEKRYIDVKLGEQALVHYRATNLSKEPVTGTSSFNVTPHKVGAYFNKIQCFCFTEQTLKPGESIDMPVVFFVDPEIAKNRNTSEVGDIVLSYTFYRVDKPDSGRRSASVINR